MESTLSPLLENDLLCVITFNNLLTKKKLKSALIMMSMQLVNQNLANQQIILPLFFYYPQIHLIFNILFLPPKIRIPFYQIHKMI